MTYMDDFIVISVVLLQVQIVFVLLTINTQYKLNDFYHSRLMRLETGDESYVQKFRNPR